MKKFTLIEADRYIAIDNKGIWFTEDNWPFADIEHLWAIQWHDDGTPEGKGEVEYDSGDVLNTPATRSMIERYVTHWTTEKEKQEEEQRRREEEEKRNSLSWQEAMRELESQMEEMQQRHEQTLDSMREDHDKQMERVHQRVAEAHENLFYVNEQMKDDEYASAQTESSFEPDAEYDNLTIFDDVIDPALFDDDADNNYKFEVEEIQGVDSDAVESDSLYTEVPMDSFNNVDMDLLDSEFNLELLFEEDSSEQVVSEIEQLIAEDDEEVPDAEIPDK
jgi:hypothetical protein